MTQMEEGLFVFGDEYSTIIKLASSLGSVWPYFKSFLTLSKNKIIK